MKKISKTLSGLASRHCVACEGGVKPMTEKQISQVLPAVPGWKIEKGELVRLFEFTNFYQTISFVNAVAWLANLENHHPDLEVSYSKCRIRFSTHAIGGLSDNDFICAAKINAMLVL